MTKRNKSKRVRNYNANKDYGDYNRSLDFKINNDLNIILGNYHFISNKPEIRQDPQINLTRFIERNPPSVNLDIILAGRGIEIYEKSNVSNWYYGYNLLNKKYFDDNVDAHGALYTLGFCYNEIVELIENNKKVYLCYFATSIDEYGFADDSLGGIDLWELEEIISRIIDCQVSSVGGKSLENGQRLRTFSFIMTSNK